MRRSPCGLVAPIMLIMCDSKQMIASALLSLTELASGTRTLGAQITFSRLIDASPVALSVVDLGGFFTHFPFPGPRERSYERKNVQIIKRIKALCGLKTTKAPETKWIHETEGKKNPKQSRPQRGVQYLW